MLTEINQSALQSNRLYVGGLSWGTTSEGSSGQHPDLYKNIWINQTELPRQKHPDFAWWPTGKPAAAISNSSADVLSVRMLHGHGDFTSVAHFPRTVTNPRGHTTTATYDDAGNCTQIQSPLAGTVDTFSYNGSGQLTSHVHPANGSGSQRNDTFTYYNGGPQNGYLADAIADAGGLALTTHFEYDAAWPCRAGGRSARQRHAAHAQPARRSRAREFADGERRAQRMRFHLRCERQRRPHRRAEPG